MRGRSIAPCGWLSTIGGFNEFFAGELFKLLPHAVRTAPRKATTNA